MNLNKLADDLENYQSCLTKDLYDIHMGLKQTLDRTTFISSSKDIFKEEQLVKLLNCKNKLIHNKDYKLLIKGLFKENFILYSQLYKAKAEFLRSNGTIDYDGELLSMKNAQSALLIENNRYKRKLLYSKVNKFNHEVINPIYIFMYENLNEFAVRLGKGGYLDLLLELNDMNSEMIIIQLEDFLKTTENKYQQRLKEIYKIHKIDINHNERHDAFYLWNLIKFPNEVPFEKLKYLLDELVNDLELEEPYNRIKVNIQKVGFQRSFTLPIKIPKNIALFVNLRSKFDDYKILFHEIGHSLHLSSIREDLPNLKRCWGDPSVSEAYAFLFENLLLNPNYLENYINKNTKVKTFLQTANFNRFFFIRLYVVRALWELKYADNINLTIEERKFKWGELFYSAMGFKYDGSSAYIEREFFLSVFDYLRGWVLEYQLSNYLEVHYGKEWFKSKHAGSFLKGLWKDGEIRSGEDLSHKIGFNSISIEFLKKYVDTL